MSLIAIKQKKALQSLAVFLLKAVLCCETLKCPIILDVFSLAGCNDDYMLDCREKHID